MSTIHGEVHTVAADPGVLRLIDDLNNTPLHEAVRLNCPEIASLLIRKGADVNAKGDLGNTALHFSAAREQPVGLAEILIGKGTDIESRNSAKETPLLIAAGQNHDVAGFLLQQGAELDLNSAVLLGLADRVRALLEQDPKLSNVLFPDELLWHAVRSGSAEMVRLLLSHRIPPNARAFFEALQYALGGLSDPEVIQLFLDAGADPNGRLYGRSGETPLQYAQLFEGDRAQEIVALLKGYGATA